MARFAFRMRGCRGGLLPQACIDERKAAIELLWPYIGHFACELLRHEVLVWMSIVVTAFVNTGVAKDFEIADHLRLFLRCCPLRRTPAPTCCWWLVVPSWQVNIASIKSKLHTPKQSQI